MIGTAVHICPGAKLAGRVAVESGALVGIGATVLQNLRIGYEAVVGGGAVVIADVAPMTTVVGVPAKVVDAPVAVVDVPAARSMSRISRIPPARSNCLTLEPACPV